MVPYHRQKCSKIDEQVFVPKDQSFFVQISDQLLDLRRILAHGQKTIYGWARDRNGESQELQGKRRRCKVELDVTRSNLKMIEKNNEMLEGAVRSLSDKHGTNPRDVGSSYGTAFFTSLPSAGSLAPQIQLHLLLHPFSLHRTFIEVLPQVWLQLVLLFYIVHAGYEPKHQQPSTDSCGRERQSDITGAGISNRDTNTNTSIAGSDASDTPTPKSKTSNAISSLSDLSSRMTVSN
ncbi:hypothetical protein DFJ43DRAFT_1041436 [Lentinula guzmanii]|uniref:Uncharacterized protein n=1 Tax=Lentinula guzmanii TaxID=2804957 RepID=A0AA38JIJ4_9AGAR|nr:hypothetical protein DFJ43DRAFT_1041436 [Lentinula guzmanii]